MNLYRVVYQCGDGYEGEEIVCAVNRIMAFDLFADFGYENVINADVFRLTEEEEEAYYNERVCD